MNQEDQIVERLNRFYRDARTEVPATAPAWVAPGRRSRVRLMQPVLASAALTVLAISVVVGVRLAKENRSQVRVAATATPSALPTVSATPAPTPSPSVGANWVTQHFAIGSVSAMLLDSSAVFALYAPSPTNGAADPTLTKVARIGRATGTVITGPSVPNATAMARVASGVWIAAGAGQPPAATGRLTLVDPTTLAVKRQLDLPGQTQTPYLGPQLVGNTQLLWLGYGAHLFRLDAGTGSTISTQSLPGTATSLSLDASGRRLYVGLEIFGNELGSDRVLELDASTGATLAAADSGGRSTGGPHVAAAMDGVWISFATGMMGAVDHRSAANLSELSSGPQRYPNGDVFRASNGIHVVVGGGAVWFFDGMSQELSCAEVTTGAIRASSQQTFPQAFVADSAAAYMGGNGIDALQPPAVCRG